MRRRQCFVAVGVLIAALDVEAGRAIRVNFGDEWVEHALGTSQCFGSSTGNPLVHRLGFTFSGHADPLFDFEVDAYCQRSVSYDPENPSNGYFSQSSLFEGDELVLRQMIGPNLDGNVSAIRYTYLGGDRFDSPTGFQWTFFDFSRQGVVLVGLYGLTGIPFTPGSSYIDDGGARLWDGWYDGYDGQYFCFEFDPNIGGWGYRPFGTWDGTLSAPTNPCLQEIATLFEDGMEDPFPEFRVSSPP
jgi:hypothetical protein